MEILAENVSYTAAIILTAYLTLGIITSLVVCLDSDCDNLFRFIAFVAMALCISALAWVWEDPTYVTYTAVVTDWNEVYEQGYEVIETNGKIVTIRKVGD